MTATVRVHLVSDVVCPWCVIGYKQLERAVTRLNGAVRVALSWEPFELNPDMPPEGQNLRAHIVEKYRITREQSDAARDKITAIGAELGFAFRYQDDSRMVNSFEAHQLSHWAGETGGQTALKLRLFEAYFTEGRDVSSRAVLLDAAAAAGLDRASAAEALEDGRFRDAVRARQRFWLGRGIQGVPSMILNERLLITGAQGDALIAEALTRAAQEPSAPVAQAAREDAHAGDAMGGAAPEG